MTGLLKNKDVKDLVRVGLLIMLCIYIVIRIMSSTGMFMEELRCGAETVAIVDGKEYFEANGYRFDNAAGRTNEQAFEGQYSVKLTPEREFGFSITLGTPKRKELYEGSVWFHEDKISADTTGWPFIVVTIGKHFWQGTIDVVQKKNGWNKLEFNIVVPDSAYTDPLVVYCWNNTKNNVYFDNMTIKRKNIKKFFRR
jgi:hypothetical protein